MTPTVEASLHYGASKSKFKNEFKRRLYNFTLQLIEFIDKLPNDNVSKRIGRIIKKTHPIILLR
jgi:hypothetical protein